MAKGNQEQHKVPRVYLKKFGYKSKKNHWLVTVGTIGTNTLQQKYIKSFTTATNHFDIDSNQDKVVKVFEDQFNQLVETHYNKIIDELEKKEAVTEPIKEYLTQMIPNFIVRSDLVREEVMEILNSEKREPFIKLLIENTKLNPGVIMIGHEVMFEAYKKMKNEDLINRILILVSNYLFLRIWGNEFIILKSPDGREWWTSDTPVVAYDESEKKLLYTKETEFYMPLTPSMLLYIHNKDSQNKNNPLRLLPSNKFHQVDENTHDGIMKHIIINCSQHIILAGFFEDDYFTKE